MSIEKIFSQTKIIKHPDKINNWLVGNPQTVITCEIDMTNRCDSRCRGCAGGRKNPKASLTKYQAFNIIRQLYNFGVRGLIFTGGGEPLLNRHTLEAVVFAHSLGLDVGLITNGLSLNDLAVRTILNNCVWCRVSLDAGSSDMYSLTHGLNSESFFRVLSNIQNLADSKKRLKSDCTVGVGYLTSRDTLKEILLATKLCSDLGVDYIQFRPYHFDETPIERELKEAKTYERDDFRVLYSQHKYSHFGEKQRPYGKCYGVNFATVITADYKVTTCCHTRGKEKYTLGDLNEDSFDKIWRARQQVFDRINFKDCGPPFCRCDTFNRILWEIKQPTQHVNFL